VLRENGNNRWIIAYGYRETDLLGNPTRLYGFVRDVSISKKFQADYIKSIMS
jgi:PAS domain-containing protein